MMPLISCLPKYGPSHIVYVCEYFRCKAIEMVQFPVLGQGATDMFMGNNAFSLSDKSVYGGVYDKNRTD